MDDIKIEKGIPLPVRRVATRRYPFADMIVGDSFATCVADRAESKKRLSNIMGAARRANGRFACRTLTEEGHLVVRCWRIE